MTVTVTATIVPGNSGQTIYAVTATDAVEVTDTVGTPVVTSPTTMHIDVPYRDDGLWAQSKGPRRSPRRSKVRSDWLSPCVFIVPHQIREPWLGDLREDRAEMARKGMPRWWIGLCTASQLLILFIKFLWAKALEAADVVRRPG